MSQRRRRRRHCACCKEVFELDARRRGAGREQKYCSKPPCRRASKVAAQRSWLFEFSYPAPKRSDPKRPVCDHGITHFCIEVTDIEGAYERLKASGAPFHCPPLEFSATVKATYGRDPDGNVFELLQMSRGA